MSDSGPGSSGIGFVGLLTIVFIALRLLNKITWSWWWVLSPVLVSIALVVIAGGVVLCVVVFRSAKR